MCSATGSSAGRGTSALRIGIILDKFPGVSETFLVQHIGAMLRAGHEVVVFAREVPRPAKVHPAIAEFGILNRICFLPYQRRGLQQLMAVPISFWRARSMADAARTLNVWRYGAGVLRLRALHGLAVVKRASFDILHCHYASIGWAFLSYKNLFGVPFVTSFHGDHFAMFQGRRERLLRPLFAHGDAFVANSEHTRTELMRMGCREEKIWTIPAIVDDADIVPNDAVLRGTETHLLTVARLDIAKGIQCALRAVRLLVDRGYCLRYTVAGEGPFRQNLEALVDELALRDVVQFTGWQSKVEVYALHRRADVFVLPSVRIPHEALESQGLVLQEAQLHGVPVVGSDIGGIPESLDWGRAGSLFHPGDHENLAATLAAIIDSPDGAKAKARAAEEYVRGKYTPQVVAARLEALYRSLIAAAPNNSACSAADAPHSGHGRG